jgi:prevent-host-death family protein
MTRVTIHKAKTELSKLIARAEQGEDIVIMRGKAPVVRLVKVEPATGRRFGAFKDTIRFDDSFFDPLPRKLLKRWTGESSS